MLSRENGERADGEPTETGVVLHNVTFKIISSQKLLQPLFGHCCLKSERMSLVLFHYRSGQVCTKHLLPFFFTCTREAISMGSMARGNRRMLKSEMDVKAFSAVKMLSELTLTNTANVARETCPYQRTRKT